jgi:hypothetical protein
VPNGDGKEVIAQAADITAVAVETPITPDARAGVNYAMTGPQTLIVNEVAV